MPVPLRDVLVHPSLAPAEPELLTGDDATLVRWVHSSEVLSLAHLLRGGELVLTAGFVLAAAPVEQQRRYVRELVARGVTAVAIETSEPVPRPVVAEAERLGFAVVHLRCTVPFVGVAESVNGLLINESVHRLRLADTVSDELSEQLISGGDVHGLVDHLASRLRALVSVRDGMGRLLAQSTVDLPLEPGTRREAPIPLRQVVAATLVVRPGDETDPVLLEAALDRAPHAFALALMRAHPSDASSGAVGVLFRALHQPERDATSIASLVESTPLAGETSFAVVVVPTVGQVGSVEQAIRRRGRPVLSHLAGEELLSVVGLPDTTSEQARHELLADLTYAAREQATRAGVSPLARSAAELPRAMTEARRCLDLGASEAVVDAADYSVERLVTRLGDRDALEGFVHEHLGAVLQLDEEPRERLLSTLVAYFDCVANKTATAKRLHLQRQTLYQRLDRLAEVLQQDLTTPSRDLAVAVRVFQALEVTRHHVPTPN